MERQSSAADIDHFVFHHLVFGVWQGKHHDCVSRDWHGSALGGPLFREENRLRRLRLKSLSLDARQECLKVERIEIRRENHDGRNVELK